jgi:hypothetical protein
LAGEVTRLIQSQHTYDVPESIVLNIEETGSNLAYLDWIRRTTTATASAAMKEPAAPAVDSGK